jgi:hypothetical protein
MDVGREVREDPADHFQILGLVDRPALPLHCRRRIRGA